MALEFRGIKLDMSMRVFGQHRTVVAVFLLMSITMCASVAEAAISDGAVCTSKGKIVGVQAKNGRTDFICKAEGKKLVWRVLKSESGAAKPGSKSGTTGSTTAGKTSGKIVIESLPVNLSGNIWQWPTDSGVWPARESPPIHVFGKAYIPGKLQPDLTFDMLKVGTPVLSPITGIVLEVRNQPESCDVELYLSNGSNRPISLDHITTSRSFKKGDAVKAGEVVGSVPKWDCNSNFGRFEFMMMSEVEEKLAVCPVNYFSDKLVAIWKPLLAKVMNDWNDHASARGYVTYSPQEIAAGACASTTAPG